MKPSYEELEQMLEESRREFRSADITMQNLEAQLKQSKIDADCYKKGMEASNARLVQLAAENAGLKNVDSWMSRSDVGYAAQAIAEGNGADADESLRAGMRAIIDDIPTPVTDAFLNEVRASAIDSIVDIKTKQLEDMHPDTHAFGATAMSIRSQINELQVFAAQLRKGVQS